jgi:hypothetical protein
MTTWLRRCAWVFLSAALALGCKKKSPEAGGEAEPSNANRCTYAAPDVKCPDHEFCYVAAKDLTGKDPANQKIWGTCQKKRDVGEECESADDCANPDALCDSEEPGGKAVCTLE